MAEIWLHAKHGRRTPDDIAGHNPRIVGGNVGHSGLFRMRSVGPHCGERWSGTGVQKWRTLPGPIQNPRLPAAAPDVKYGAKDAAQAANAAIC